MTKLFGNQTKYDVDIANIHIKQQLLRFKDNRKFLALDISDILCEPTVLRRCYDFKEGVGPIYNNQSHLSHLGAKLVVNLILKKLKIY